MESYLKKLGLWDILKTQKKIPVPTTILQIMHGEKHFEAQSQRLYSMLQQASSHGGKSTSS